MSNKNRPQRSVETLGLAYCCDTPNRLPKIEKSALGANTVYHKLATLEKGKENE